MPCLIMSKDSVYTFHEVSSKRNSMLMCVCKITTYELIFVSDCLTVYVYRLTNSNLYFVIKTWATVRKSIDTILWGPYQGEFTIRIPSRGVLCNELYNTWKQAENVKKTHSA